MAEIGKSGVAKEVDGAGMRRLDFKNKIQLLLRELMCRSPD